MSQATDPSGSAPSPRWLRRRHLVTLGAMLLGAAGMAAYTHFVGCRTGTCPLTSNPWTASLYGAVVGLVAFWPASPRPEGPAEGRDP
jgi:hypothetical protein